MEPNINQYRVGNCKAMEFSKIIFSKYLDKNITILVRMFTYLWQH